MHKQSRRLRTEDPVATARGFGHGILYGIMSVTFNDLVELMDRLRAPEGCPWDREQTYTTLAPMLLEEAYEAFEAVEDAIAGRPAGLRDELGDMLFQIVFYAQVAKERGDFSIDDVTDTVHSKMV